VTRTGRELGKPTCVGRQSPVSGETVPELIAYAKANPGKESKGSPSGKLAAPLRPNLFKCDDRRRHGDLVGISRRGPCDTRTSSAGLIQVLFGLRSDLERADQGGSRCGLGGTIANADATVAGLPPHRRFVPGYYASSWHGISGLQRSPAFRHIDKLTMRSNAGLARTQIQVRFTIWARRRLPALSSEFRQVHIVELYRKMAKVIRAAGINADSPVGKHWELRT